MLIIKSKSYVKDLIKIFKYKSLYSKFSKFTMAPEVDYVDCIDLIAKYKDIQGCVIECGVWRGGMIAGIAKLLGNNRKYYLFDSFEGLPPATEEDGKAAIEWQKDANAPNYHNNCEAEQKWAEQAMAVAGIDNYQIVKGWFDDTIPGFIPEEPIAILRLDGDWYNSTMVCLDHFFNKVVNGGLIVLDDYYAWEGCSKALHDYLSKNNRPEKITKAYTSGCFLIKKEV